MSCPCSRRFPSVRPPSPSDRPCPFTHSPVKLTDPITRLQCDVNINDQFGVRNSALLRAYLDAAGPASRPLASALKHWARVRGLVGASPRLQLYMHLQRV
jgi:hypothetical protein